MSHSCTNITHVKHNDQQQKKYNIFYMTEVGLAGSHKQKRSD